MIKSISFGNILNKFKSMDTLTKTGFIVTTLYILFILCLRWGDFSELSTIALNEFGDFFAGVFGPLAIFWLIVGFLQQQNELKQSTKALQMQAKELKNAVEQHKEMVKVARDQMDSSTKQRNTFLSPELSLNLSSSSRGEYIFNLRNNKNSVNSFEITHNNKSLYSKPFLRESDIPNEFTIKHEDMDLKNTSLFIISYINLDGHKVFENYRLSKGEISGYILKDI